MKNDSIPLIIGIVILLTYSFMLNEITNQKTKIKELETKLTQSQAIQDSIKEEMFVMDIDLGRYEFVIESLDTNCKEKALNILSNTE
jgi:hypothetical protein